MKRIEELKRKARYFNDTKAQFELGQLFLKGDEVAADAAEARDWLEKAARQGHEQAKVMLEELTGEHHEEPAPITPEYSAPITPEYSAPIAPLDEPKAAEPEAPAPEEDPSVAEAIQKELERIQAEAKAAPEPEPEPTPEPELELEPAPVAEPEPQPEPKPEQKPEHSPTPTAAEDSGEAVTAKDCPSCGAKLRQWEGDWRCWMCGWPEEKQTATPAPQDKPEPEEQPQSSPAQKEPDAKTELVVPAPPAIPVEEPEPAPPPIPVEQPTDKSKKKDRKCPDCGDALRKFEGKWRCWTCGWPDHQTSGHTATQLGSKKEKRQPTAPKGAWLGSKQKKSNEGTDQEGSSKEASTGCWWILAIAAFIMFRECDGCSEEESPTTPTGKDIYYQDDMGPPPGSMDDDVEQPPPGAREDSRDNPKK